MPSDGYAPLISQLQRVQEHFHDVADWRASNLITTNGSQDGLCKAMEMLIGGQARID